MLMMQWPALRGIQLLAEPKKGDLAGGFVYKFKCNGQLTLLAYVYDPGTRLLLLLGSHENFYRDLKR